MKSCWTVRAASTAPQGQQTDSAQHRYQPCNNCQLSASKSVDHTATRGLVVTGFTSKGETRECRREKTQRCFDSAFRRHHRAARLGREWKCTSRHSETTQHCGNHGRRCRMVQYWRLQPGHYGRTHAEPR